MNDSIAQRPARDLIARGAPHGLELVAQGRTVGQHVTVGRSLLCETHGVASEVEYKRKMAAEGRMMTALSIGMQTWAETARALENIHAQSEARGFRIDRYQMQVDRRMGLPRQFWTRAAKETGPMLESPEDWRATARTVPIQPHLGDMMIGSPASVDNCCRALEAGVNYVGNMGQFAWKYPGWPGTDVEQMAEMVKALGVMASKVDRGVMVHTYSEDGFPAQFRDFCSYIGWATFERYIVDTLVGANLSVSYGGLTRNPVTKAAMILALESITPAGNMNAYYTSNTTAYSEVLDENFGVCSIDMMYMMLARRRAGGGTALKATPITEPIRIPTWEEIVEIQTVAYRISREVDRLAESINWPHIEAIAERLVEGGRRFYENLMQGLEEMGVDMTDPLQLLVAVRRMGAPAIEARFGVGERADVDEDGYQPAIPSDTFLDLMERRDRMRAVIGAPVQREKRPVVVVGSSDVHEYALTLLLDAVERLGGDAVVAGTGVDPDEFAEVAREANADAMFISTHNGMALSFAEQLLQELSFRNIAPTVAIGGTLNQDDGETAAPVDVRSELESLGVVVCEDVTDVASLLR